MIKKIDALSFLHSLDDESIDLIITDPPYESLEKHRKRGTTTRLKQSKSSSNKWFDIFPNDKFPELFSEMYRVLKNNTHLYFFCDQETMFIAKPIGEDVGFTFWKPLVWDCVNIGMGYHYRVRYQFILFFEKGKRKLNNLSIPDILTVKRIRNGYPTEKPVELSEILISQSTSDEEESIVLDPFMGSGSVGVAACNLGRTFWGCDTSNDAIEYAYNRDRIL